MADLKQCPFCGGNEIIIRQIEYVGITEPRFLPSADTALHKRGLDGQQKRAQLPHGI